MQASGSVGLGRSPRPCVSIIRHRATGGVNPRLPAESRHSVIAAARGGRKGGEKNFWEKLTGDEGPFKNFGNFGKGDASDGGRPGGFGGKGAGGGGGGSGGFGGSPADDDEDGPEKSIWEEMKQLFGGIWVVFWNTVVFLAFADILHRSLDWCCQIELLLLVGAPQQAWERAASVFYSAIEAFERNVLGWDIPQEDMIPMYENLALYYPEEHAYTFDSYRYKDMTSDEKQKLKYFYALRHYERDGGQAGDVDAQDVQAIQDKYEPMEADRRAYLAAKANGTVDQYWAENKEVYMSMVRGGGSSK